MSTPVDREPRMEQGASVWLWLLRRILIMGAQLLAISVLVFASMHLTPGSPEQVLLGDNPATPEALQAIRDRFDLEGSIPSQYVNWLGQVAQFDFGRSIKTSQPVVDAIGDRLPTTLFLAAYALLIVIVIAIPLGLVAGVRAGSRLDRAIGLGTTVGISAPSFAIGTALLYIFAVTLGWFPVYGAGEGLVDRAWHLTLPAITLALAVVAIVARQTRAASMSVSREDFMMFAEARGLPRRIIWGRYLLRNSSLPVATTVGLVVALFLTGAVIVEATFSLPGIGTLMVQSIADKDIPVVQGLCMLVALMVLLTNLVADLSYAALDPRVRKRMFG